MLLPFADYRGRVVTGGDRAPTGVPLAGKCFAWMRSRTTANSIGACGAELAGGSDVLRFKSSVELNRYAVALIF